MFFCLKSNDQSIALRIQQACMMWGGREMLHLGPETITSGSRMNWGNILIKIYFGLLFIFKVALIHFFVFILSLHSSLAGPSFVMSYILLCLSFFFLTHKFNCPDNKSPNKIPNNCFGSRMKKQKDK